MFTCSRLVAPFGAQALSRRGFLPLKLMAGGLMAWKICGLAVGVMLSIGIESQAAQPAFKPLEITSEDAAGLLEKAMTNPRIQAIIRQHVHPNATIVSLENLNTGSRERFLNAVDDNSPGFIVADFNGDGVADYAALLRFPKKASLGEWLVAFMGRKDGGFQLRLLEKYDGFHDDVYITIEPPGEVKPSNSSRPVKLQASGIARIQPDSPATVFYWGRGGFQRLRMSAAQSSGSSLPSNR
jgi:hypothetical protein